MGKEKHDAEARANATREDERAAPAAEMSAQARDEAQSPAGDEVQATARDDGGRRESRRRFTKRAAVAALATPAALTAARGQTRPAPPESPAPPRPQPTPQPSPAGQQPQQPPSPVAAAYLEVARALYGRHLTPEEFERLRRDLENNARTSERLQAVKLGNGDEPDFVFGA